jgi:hypothetical protein
MIGGMALSIACLGWGSLIWKPAQHAGAPLEAQGIRAGLATAGGSWHDDGPRLPLELARDAFSTEADAPYPSWVITPGAPPSPALWARLTVPADVGADVDRALWRAAQALAVREGAALSCIGRCDRLSDGHGFAGGEIIAAWAASQGLDGVVWTALTPRWFEAERAPTQAEVLDLLRGLITDHRAGHAEAYVRQTPVQTMSPYRAAIEAELGWRPANVRI